MSNTFTRARSAGIRMAVAAAVMAGGLALVRPALAAMEEHGLKEGTVTIFMAKGAMMEAEIADKATLDEIVKGAKVLEDHTMVVAHGGKLYLVMDHKMASGATVSEVVAHMSMH